LPDNLTYIGSRAFYGATSLSMVYVPVGCSVGFNAFSLGDGLGDIPWMYGRGPPPSPPSPPLLSPSPSPPSRPLLSPSPSSPGAGAEATSNSGATQDAGPGLAIGLALGGCLLVALLGVAVFVWHRKRRMQAPPSSASTAAPQEVEVIVAQPESNKAAAPQSLSALLAACGLEHHEETFRAEGYTLDTLLSSLKRGEEAAKSDLRDLKLTLGECRKLINELQDSK
jgi:hypothetical protein